MDLGTPPRLHKTSQPIALTGVGGLDEEIPVCTLWFRGGIFSLPMTDLLAPTASTPKLQLLDVGLVLPLAFALSWSLTVALAAAGIVTPAQSLLFQSLAHLPVGGQSRLDFLLIHNLVKVAVGEVDVLSLVRRLAIGLFKRLSLGVIFLEEGGLVLLSTPILAFRPSHQPLILSLRQTSLAVEHVPLGTVGQIDSLLIKVVESALHSLKIGSEYFVRGSRLPVHGGLEGTWQGYFQMGKVHNVLHSILIRDVLDLHILSLSCLKSFTPRFLSGMSVSNSQSFTCR